MSAVPLSHPDRLATTLATLPAARAARPVAGCAAIGVGSADCRIDIKVAQWHALRAAERSEAAAAHLGAYDRDGYPELWAGTVQDGVARGFLVHLEESCSLAEPEAEPVPAAPPSATAFRGKELRRKKDILVASATSRIRFSRRGGLLLIDRERDVHSENCLWFEARRDEGHLDQFGGNDSERPRLFSAQFLKPTLLLQDKQFQQLELEGRLGRRGDGWPCRIVIVGSADAPCLRMTIELPRPQIGWRLRSRFLGVPAQLLHHHCMPVREVVATEHGGFVADTLIRSCATLLVDGSPTAVPGAADPGAIRHTFSLGNPQS